MTKWLLNGLQLIIQKCTFLNEYMIPIKWKVLLSQFSVVCFYSLTHTALYITLIATNANMNETYIFICNVLSSHSPLCNLLWHSVRLDCFHSITNFMFQQILDITKPLSFCHLKSTTRRKICIYAILTVWHSIW